MGLMGGEDKGGSNMKTNKLKFRKIRDKHLRLYSLRKGNKTIFQVEDCGNYIRIYPINYHTFRCDSEMISFDLKNKKR